MCIRDRHDPVVEYRLEGFDMFDEMIAAIREDTARMMLTLRLQVQRAPAREPAAAANSGAPGAGAAAAQPQDAAGTGGQDSQPQTPVPPPAPARYIAPKREQVAKPTSTSGGSDGSDSAGKTVRKGKKVGRNDPDVYKRQFFNDAKAAGFAELWNRSDPVSYTHLRRGGGPAPR